MNTDKAKIITSPILKLISSGFIILSIDVRRSSKPTNIMIKDTINEAIACNGWVLVETHSAHNAFFSGANDEAFAEIINYARSNGVEIRTVNEELRRRMPIYNYYEQY